MTIPKGLILYRAERHQKDLSTNKKYGLYSNKLSSSFMRAYNEPIDNSHKKYKKRFVQGICLLVHDKCLETNQAKRLLRKYNHIKKCIILPLSCSFEEIPSTKITMKEFQKTFKILKRIKDLKAYFSGQIEGQACKTLLLLTNLESLSLPLFNYSDSSKSMDLFEEAVKLASKRRSWKNFKSLNMRLCAPAVSHANNGDGPLKRSLEQLLEFLKDLKENCQDIYKRSSLQLELPQIAGMNFLHANMLVEIAKIAPMITKIHGFEMNACSGLSSMAKHCIGLKEISLNLDERFKHDPDLSVLNKLPDFQNFALEISRNKKVDLNLCKNVLKKVQNLKNLTLSLKFRGIPMISFEDKVFDMPKVISDLTNLTSLELHFDEKGNYGRPFQKSNGVWLRDTLKAIGEKSKLEKLLISFDICCFENPGMIFKSLCQSVQKLPQLTVLKLEINAANTVGDEDLAALSHSLSRLKNIEDLTLKISKPYYFKIKVFIELLDCIANSFPLLSKLDLNIASVRTSVESYQLLSAAISRMKGLNSIKLSLTGEIEPGVDVKNLEALVNQKITGTLSHSKRYWP